MKKVFETPSEVIIEADVFLQYLQNVLHVF